MILTNKKLIALLMVVVIITMIIFNRLETEDSEATLV